MSSVRQRTRRRFRLRCGRAALHYRVISSFLGISYGLQRFLSDAAMNEVPLSLSARDRIELLCWLTCGSLGAFYLNGDWPAATFHVQAAHKWLDRHQRVADWLAVAKLSAIARELATRHCALLEADWAREAVEEILDSEDLNYQSDVVRQVFEDCRRALAEKRVPE